jgi:A/G-specific adenine glycosylase
MVSEFMLQQTPVKRVLPAWTQWLERWPSPKDLANASPADAIRMWANLGYPRRAMRLHQSAQIIAQHHNNQVPNNFETLITLPGVGDYTANAILAFAFGQPTVVLDINVRRVIARAWQGQAHPSTSSSAVERAFAQSLIDQELTKKSAPRWAAASMELGALICTATTPQCSICPLEGTCQWNKLGKPDNTAKPKTQAKYLGSDRAERGRILKILRTTEAPQTLGALTKNTPDPDQCNRALASLVAEGLVVNSGRGKFSLPHK